MNCNYCGTKPTVGDYGFCEDRIHLQFVNSGVYQELKADREKEKK